MAKAFKTWTVLPHDPIEKLEENLWRVSGKMPDGKTQRSMVIARRLDGGLVVHNAIALGEAEMKELEGFGKPSVLVVPNGFHRMDARIWKDRYPEMQVVCPAGARKKVEHVVPVDATVDQAPGDDSVTFAHAEGVKNAEVVLTVRSGDHVSLVFCDLVLNMPKLRGPVGFFLAPTGQPSVPRAMRWLAMKDRAALVRYLEQLASAPGLTRILVGHGRTITESPSEALRAVARELAQ